MSNAQTFVLATLAVASMLGCRKSEQHAAPAADVPATGPVATADAAAVVPPGPQGTALTDAQVEQLLGAPYEDHTNRPPPGTADGDDLAANDGYQLEEGKMGRRDATNFELAPAQMVGQLAQFPPSPMSPGAAMPVREFAAGDGVGSLPSGGRMGRGRSGPDLAVRTGATPDLRLGDATAFGSLSKEVIRRIVMQHRGRFRRCYEVALRTNPQLAGRLTMQWQITVHGNVQDAQVREDLLGDATLASCVETVVTRMTFPQADGVTAVAYPFDFSIPGAENTEVVVVADDQPPGDCGRG